MLKDIFVKTAVHLSQGEETLSTRENQILIGYLKIMRTLIRKTNHFA